MTGQEALDIHKGLFYIAIQIVNFMQQESTCFLSGSPVGFRKKMMCLSKTYVRIPIIQIL